jgi:thioredoxin reductase (NADPH)
VEITPGEVLSVFRENGCFAVKVKDGVYRALSVIIATGLSPKRLGLSGERELFGELVFSYENPEQLPCRNKQVLVIGSGDAAFDQALNFSRFASGVSIAMRSEKPRCAPLLLKRAKIAGVEIFAGCEVVSMKKVSGRLHIDFADGKTRETDLFDICIGKEKNFDFISSDLLVGGVPGIFFAGDCHRDHARHVVIACGDGTAAAMEAAEYLFKMVDNKGMR